MDVDRLYIWICFFFSIALAAGGTLIFFQKKEIRQIPATRFLQYFLILVYTFGFYSMWSDVFFRTLFFAVKEYESIARLPEYLALIGTPFLITAMFMLVLWALNLMKRKPRSFFMAIVSLLVLLIILTYIAYRRFDLLLSVRQIYALLVMLITLLTGILLYFSASDYFEKKSRNILVFLVILSGAIHVPLFLNYLNTPVPELIFIFLFFLTNTCTGIYFTYNVKVVSIRPEEDIHKLSFDQFIEEYGITPRESEVVREIYKGKTNREIADKLFVTVQTVKDHTHRIYLKTNLRNRAQLTSFLRKYEQ